MSRLSVFPASLPPASLPSRGPFARLAPGLALAAALALVAQQLAHAPWLGQHGLGPSALAIVLGMAAGNLMPARARAASDAGVSLARQRLLRLGIVLYGLRLTFQDIGHIGLAGVAIDAAMLCSTFTLACTLGPRVFGLDGRTSMLIGAGSAICGAAAVMAAEPVVRGKPAQATVAVSTVVVFGTLAIFLYPALYRLAAPWHLAGLTPVAYGIYAGSTIHEVAQVIAAGHAVGGPAANAAVIAKMVRVMMLAPFLVGLSAWLARTRERDAGMAPGPRISIPWFAVGFVLMAGVRSLGVVPAPVVAGADTLSTAALAMAMAALGVSTRVTAIREAGLRPLALAAMLFAWLVIGGAAINLGLGHALAPQLG